MPSYKLIYFDARGRGETARMLFKLAGVDFEDKRVDYPSAEWDELKQKIPMGALPVLEIDGQQLFQSNAINRYLAREFGFDGKDNLSQARTDMIVGCIEDLTAPTDEIFFAKEEEVKVALAKKVREQVIEPGLTRIQKILEQNNGGNGYFVGDELTYADVGFVNVAEMVTTVVRMDFSKYPKLQALRERVESNPRIAAWIKERPKTAL